MVAKTQRRSISGTYFSCSAVFTRDVGRLIPFVPLQSCGKFLAFHETGLLGFCVVGESAKHNFGSYIYVKRNGILQAGNADKPAVEIL